MNYGYGTFNIFINSAKTSTKRSPNSVILRPQFPYPSKAKLILQLIQTKQHLYCTITVHLYTHTYKAYSETLIFCYLLYTLLYTSIFFNVGRSWLGRSWRGAHLAWAQMTGCSWRGAMDGAQMARAQMTGRSWRGAQDIESFSSELYYVMGMEWGNTKYG